MKRLFDYIEIKTKITSLLTFMLVILLFIYHGVEIKVMETAVFFSGMFLFDLTTTAINNYIDSKTNGEDFGFSRKTMRYILFSLLIISTILGLYLVYLTDWIVLLLGAISFFVGITYTFGPIPISRQPYGEIISGVFYGYMIPLILMYINLESDFVTVDIGTWIDVSVNTRILIQFIIVGMIPTLLTGAIMLGNNACDLEDDILVDRYTLPYYIGQDMAGKLLWFIYFVVYLFIIFGVISSVYSNWMLISLITAPIVLSNAKELTVLFDKDKSFPFVIKNFIMIMGIMIVIQLCINLFG